MENILLSVLVQVKKKKTLYIIFKNIRNQFPNGGRTGRLFRKFNNNLQKRDKSPIGKNKIGKIPFKIATYLKENLPTFKADPSKFTGHAFRRTAATWAADSGVSLINLKRFGRWKSDSVCQEYVDKSEKVKEDAAISISLPPFLQLIFQVLFQDVQFIFKLKNNKNITFLFSQTKKIP